MVNRNLVQFDIGVKNMAGWIAASAVTIPGGFVQMSASDYTFEQSTLSTTKKALGILTASATAASTTNEIRTGGYVWQLCQITMAAGDPVHPSATRGKVGKSGAANGVTAGYLWPAGFGTCVVGASGSAYCLTKLHSLV